ncbi:MAG: AarF/UbiB family protein [Pseudomonadota bacterium]
MIKPHFIQFIRIFYLVFRYNLDEFLLQAPYFRRLYFLRWCNPFYIFSNRFISRGQRLTLALQKAGPLFVKFGQILSTRQDIFPKDIVDQLVTLQDKVPPFSPNIARQLIHPLSHFSHVNYTPIASASIAQVHAATLHDGTHVVIKILRPKIRALLARDIAFLRWGAKFIKLENSSAIQGMIDEIEMTLKQETNLVNEAAHAEQLKENAKINHATSLFIPDIYWDLTTENRLVMERIYGLPIMNIAAIKDAGVNLHALAKKCVEIFFTQMFQDNYFHADLHPGNIFINVTKPECPIIELVDFGIVGSLPLKDRRYIAENMAALIDKDYRKVAKLHRESGWIPAYVPEIAFAHAIQTVCAPILNKSLKDISLAQLLLGLIQAAKNYEIQLQPQLLLLQKTLLNIESLCRHLDPDFNIWDVTQPILKRWLKDQIGPMAMINFLKNNLPVIIRNMILYRQ